MVKFNKNRITFLTFFCYVRVVQALDESMDHRCETRRNALGTEGLMKRSLSTSTIIQNGRIMLGVGDAGELNVPGGPPDNFEGQEVVGLRYKRPTDGGWYDSLSYGCNCEGFGVSATIIESDQEFWGGSNQGDGEYNLSPQPIVSDGKQAITKVDVTTGPMRVIHHFFPSPTSSNVYEIKVTIENTSPTDTLTNIRYRRMMDWDTPPTLYNMCVSIFYDMTPNDLEYATDNGFVSSNPLIDDTDSFYYLIECGLEVVSDCPAYDRGPMDHGAMFNFLFKDVDNLRTVGPGEVFSFGIFYGAASTKDEADNIIQAIGADIISYGFPSIGGIEGEEGTGTCDHTGEPNVFMFGFKTEPSCPIDPKPKAKFWTGKTRSSKTGKIKAKKRSCKWLKNAGRYKINKYCAQTDGFHFPWKTIPPARDICTGTCNSC